MDSSDFLRTIRDWSTGLIRIVVEKIVASVAPDLVKRVNLLPSSKIDVNDFILTFFRKHNLTSHHAVQRYLNSSKRRISVYIDDLDRGWQGKKEDITRISALLNSVRDMSNSNRGLGFKIALRADVYYLVRTSDESTDKIEGSVVWQTWTNYEIFVLLVKRIETYFGGVVKEQHLLGRSLGDLAVSLNKVMEPRFSGKGHWADAPMYRVLLSLIRKRPRDLVKLCTLAAKQAYMSSSTTIRTSDLENVFEQYSHGRIQDTINEYRSELPNIEQLIMNMKPSRVERETKTGYVYRTADLLKKIHNIMQSNAFIFANGTPAREKDLASFMYKINFLTARKETDHKIVRKYFEENRYLSSQFADFGFDWEVHPAYRWALQPDRIEEIYGALRLNEE